MEKLYELHSEGGFDLVVVDTPPTRHALDFVDAPRRLYSFLENRVFRLLLMPTRAYMKAMTIRGQCPVANDLPGRRARRSSRMRWPSSVPSKAWRRASGNGHVVSRTSWRTRAPPFVLVVAPREDSIDEARFFARRLAESSIAVSALVVNRLFSNFGADQPPPPVVHRARRDRKSPATAPADARDSPPARSSCLRGAPAEPRGLPCRRHS